jgi:hypothetical protein
MHPIMSDLDLSVRQFEQAMERNARQHRMLVASVARQQGHPALGTRLVHAVWQFIDPRGFALAQYRRAEQRRQPVTPTIEPTATVAATPALMHAFPIAETSDTPAWRKAA